VPLGNDKFDGDWTLDDSGDFGSYNFSGNVREGTGHYVWYQVFIIKFIVQVIGQEGIRTSILAIRRIVSFRATTIFW